MINSFKQKDGRVGVILWGALTKEPQFQTTKNGDTMAWFYVRYGHDPAHNPNDKPSAKSIKVLCFRDASESCRGLEAWENVFVCGELKESEYNGNKEFSVTADIVLAPNAQVAGIAALNEVRSIKDGSRSANDGKDPKENVANGFEDIDQSDIDDIFPGL